MNLRSFPFPVRRPLAAILLALAVLPSLPGADDFTPVAPADWTVTGGAPSGVERGRGLVIPAGAQVSRFYGDAAVELEISSRPYFNVEPAQCAFLEIGPAGLTFVRKADGGGMVLLGDEPLDLPFALPLDAEGRSVAALNFIVAFDPAEQRATLTIDQAVFEVPATATGAVEVALSAGAKRAWTLEKIAVRASVATGVNRRTAGTGHAGATAAAMLPDRNRRELLGEARASARGLFKAGEDLAAERTLTSRNRNPANSAEWHLESANALVQIAFSFARAGEPAKAARIASRALEHAEKARRKAARQPGQETLATAADETSALIQEKLLGDYDRAREFYTNAVLRKPRGGADAALSRLERINRETERKDAARRR